MVMQFLPGSLEIDNSPYDLELWAGLSRLLNPYEGYCAYKIPALGTGSLIEVPTFIIVTKQHGVILVDLVSDKIQSIEDDGRVWRTQHGITHSREIFLEQYGDEIEGRFKRSPSLYDRKNKKSLIPIERVLVFGENSDGEVAGFQQENYSGAIFISSEDYINSISSLLGKIAWNGSDKQFDDILSLIEGTWDFRGSQKPIDTSKKPETVNDFIQVSLNRTFKQDNAQRQISMQIPNGPQRIRGLAGTGKTVVLSLKAALTVLRKPEYKILYLFNTQSLYNLIERQIGDYYAKEAKSSLPQGSIDILHAWGGRTTGEGLYSKICNIYGITPLTLRDVPRDIDQLGYIFRDLEAKFGEKIQPIYDMVLVDEAQDFPNEVFNIIYRITKDPKRIVVAYDDFQSLKALKIREFDELFGNDAKGNPRFPEGTLTGNYAGGVAKDFVLPNCYRNPRNVLMVAHGIALGIKRPGGVVDSVDRTSDWKALGYQVNKPVDKSIITAGDDVEVERLDRNSTNVLEKILIENKKTSKNLIQIEKLDTDENEIIYIAERIKSLIETQGVSPHEIYVITIETKSSEDFLKKIRSKLNDFNIKSIMPGFVESSRHFHEKDCVVLTTPFRAKGNEANIVFVTNCQSVTYDATFRKRNSFFVSVTRTRGWCYITGVGDGMVNLINEITELQKDLPKFKYKRPNDDLIARRRLLLSKLDNETESDQIKLQKIAKNNPELFREFIQQNILLTDIESNSADENNG